MALPSPDSRASEPLEGLLQYRPILLNYFRKRAHPADVEDLVQDVFLNIQARQAQDPIANVEGYIFAVAMSALVRKSQRDKARRWHLNYDEIDESKAPVEEVSPERILVGKQRLARAAEIMQRMPPRTQQVFMLHRFEEMTYPAIAKALGISVSAVEKHITIGLKLLVADLGRGR